MMLQSIISDSENMGHEDTGDNENITPTDNEVILSPVLGRNPPPPFADKNDTHLCQASMVEQCRKLNATICKLTADLETSSGDCKQLVKDLETSSGDRKQLLKDLETSSGDRKQLLKDLETSSGDRKQLLKDLETSSGDRKQLLKDLETSSGECKQLQKDFDECTQEKEVLEQHIMRLEKEQRDVDFVFETREWMNMWTKGKAKEFADAAGISKDKVMTLQAVYDHPDHQQFQGGPFPVSCIPELLNFSRMIKREGNEYAHQNRPADPRRAEDCRS